MKQAGVDEIVKNDLTAHSRYAEQTRSLMHGQTKAWHLVIAAQHHREEPLP